MISEVTGQSKIESNNKSNNGSGLICRNNIFTALRLSINDLISESVLSKCEFDVEKSKAMRLINVIENYFCFGLKSIKNFMNIIQEEFSELEDGREVIQIIQNLKTLRTPYSRLRAWVAIYLLRKQFSKFYRIILTSEKIKSPALFENYACMVSEDAEIVDGLMLSLSSLDFTFVINEMNLNYEPEPIDYSYFMNLSKFSNSDVTDPSLVDSDEQTRKIMNIFNQKAYLDELVARLQAEAIKMKRDIQQISIRLEGSAKREEMAKKQVEANERDLNEYKAQQDIIIDTFKTQISNEAVSTNERIDRLQRHLTQCRQELTDAKEEKMILENVKSDLDESMRTQIDQIVRQGAQIVDLKNHVDDSKHTLGLLTKELSAKNSRVEHLEGIMEIKNAQITNLEDKIATMAVSQQNSTALISQLKQEILTSTDKLLTVERKLVSAVESKQTFEALYDQAKLENMDLQQRVEYQESVNSGLKRELARLTPYENELVRLREKHESLLVSNKEQEDALVAMGSQLQSHNLRLDELNESSLSRPVWVGDSQQPNCTLCEENFNVARRRHHCRRCGLIFCNECSDHRILLPSFVKAVRVCDSCFRSL